MVAKQSRFKDDDGDGPVGGGILTVLLIVAAIAGGIFLALGKPPQAPVPVIRPEPPPVTTCSCACPPCGGGR